MRRRCVLSFTLLLTVLLGLIRPAAAACGTTTVSNALDLTLAEACTMVDGDLTVQWSSSLNLNAAFLLLLSIDGTLTIEATSGATISTITFPLLATVTGNVVVRAVTTESKVNSVTMAALTQLDGSLRLGTSMHLGYLGDISMATSLLQPLHIAGRLEVDSPAGSLGSLSIGRLHSCTELYLGGSMSIVDSVRVNTHGLDNLIVGDFRVERTGGACPSIEVLSLVSSNTVQVVLSNGATLSALSLAGPTALSSPRLEITNISLSLQDASQLQALTLTKAGMLSQLQLQLTGAASLHALTIDGYGVVESAEAPMVELWTCFPEVETCNLLTGALAPTAPPGSEMCAQQLMDGILYPLTEADATITTVCPTGGLLQRSCCGPSLLGNVLCPELETWTDPNVSGCRSHSWDGLDMLATPTLSDARKQMQNISAILQETGIWLGLADIEQAANHTRSLLHQLPAAETGDQEDWLDLAGMVTSAATLMADSPFQPTSQLGFVPVLDALAVQAAARATGLATLSMLTVSLVEEVVVGTVRVAVSLLNGVLSLIIYETAIFFDSSTATVGPVLGITVHDGNGTALPLLGLVTFTVPSELSASTQHILRQQLSAPASSTEPVLLSWLDQTPMLTLGNSSNNTRTPASLTCAWWDFVGEQWTEDGCRLIQSGPEGVTCQCLHTTNFAVLIAGSTRDEVVLTSTERRVLSALTLTGSVICIVLLSVALLLNAVAWRRLGRIRISLQLFMQFCLALVGMHLSFLLNGYQLLPGCSEAGALLHAFILSSFLWSLAQAINIYLGCVHILPTKIDKEALFPWYFAMAWGLPAVAVALISFIAPEAYTSDQGAEDEFCWLSSNGLLWGTLVAPVALVLLLNLFTYLAALWSVWAHAKSVRSLLMLLKTGIIFSALLGLHWVFLMLLLAHPLAAWYYLFALASLLQGVIIFVYMVVLATDLREALSSTFTFTPRTKSFFTEPHVPRMSASATSLEIQQKHTIFAPMSPLTEHDRESEDDSTPEDKHTANPCIDQGLVPGLWPSAIHRNNPIAHLSDTDSAAASTAMVQPMPQTAAHFVHAGYNSQPVSRQGSLVDLEAGTQETSEVDEQGLPRPPRLRWRQATVWERPRLPSPLLAKLY